VEAVGPGVTGFAVGDEVYGATGMLGGLAEYVTLKAEMLFKKPAGISMTEAAALPVAVATAVAAFNVGEVKQGTKLLVHAAAGGVGSIAVQLANLRGAEVTALTGKENIDFVKSLGVSHVVDRSSDYESTLSGFDVVLDGFGPEAQAKSWKLLKKGGILLSLVMPPSEEVAAAHGVRAAMVYGTPTPESLGEGNKAVEAGKLKITVAKTYPFEQVPEAFAESEGGKVRGKLIVTF
jgi:NADPH:quinone reductase-like Zn-dependent oxidoreductase